MGQNLVSQLSHFLYKLIFLLGFTFLLKAYILFALTMKNIEHEKKIMDLCKIAIFE